MKILHIHPAMKGGGIEAMITALANEMSKNNDVTVCTIFDPLAEDVFWNKLSSTVSKDSLGKTTPGFSLKEIFKIYNYLRSGGFEIVHVHGFFYYYALSILLLHQKIKFIYTVHSDAFMENTVWDKRILSLKRFCFKHNWIHPITISNVSQQSFYDLYKCDNKLIFNGIAKPVISEQDSIAPYKISPTTKVFVHAGRIDASKNQIVLCKVFERLIKNGFDVVLLIAGSKQDHSIFDSIRSFFCTRIQYLGERNDISQLFAKCDGMCLPSVWEGLPVTLLEALSVGCVPICSPVGGIPNVVKSGFNGILSLSNNEEDYYQAMKLFLNQSTEECEAMKQHCISSFASYDIQNTAKNYLNYYRSV